MRPKRERLFSTPSAARSTAAAAARRRDFARLTSAKNELANRDRRGIGGRRRVFVAKRRPRRRPRRQQSKICSEASGARCSQFSCSANRMDDDEAESASDICEPVPLPIQTFLWRQTKCAARARRAVKTFFFCFLRRSILVRFSARKSASFTKHRVW